MAQGSQSCTEVKEKVYCVGCRKVFKFISDQFEHVCNEYSDLISCYVCKKSFDSRKNFIDHIFEHSGKYICGVCTDGFEDLNSFEEHVDSHEAFSTCKCDICHRSFLKIYSGNYFKKFRLCEVCRCGWKLKNAGHIRKTRRYERFACGHCNEIFKDNYAIGLHLWSHKDIRPYVCGCCPFMEIDYQDFLKHVDQHIHCN